MNTEGWTGQTACALQAALRLSNERFAEHLGIGVRTVAAWHQKPSLRPKSEMQQLLDTALERASDAERARFAELTSAQPAADPRLTEDPNIVAALEWLDRHARWAPGTSRRRVAERATAIDPQSLRDRGARRGWVSQRDVARTLADYYGTASLFTARCGDHLVNTSILTSTDWLDLDCPLVPLHDRLTVASALPEADLRLDEHAADVAVQRLAETLSMNTRMVNSPLYRLLDIEPAAHHLGGSLGVTHFVHYALTMDLLEGELVDAIAAGGSSPMPLRDRYLPDVASVLDLSNRLCSGGVLALTAIARPADPFRGEADYLVLVQERSGSVLNAARRLAVIPKGFHQPLNDVRRDAQVGATLRREMEEELFGRPDIDNTPRATAVCRPDAPQQVLRADALARPATRQAPDGVHRLRSQSRQRQLRIRQPDRHRRRRILDTLRRRGRSELGVGKPATVFNCRYRPCDRTTNRRGLEQRRIVRYDPRAPTACPTRRRTRQNATN